MTPAPAPLNSSFAPALAQGEISLKEATKQSQAVNAEASKEPGRRRSSVTTEKIKLNSGHHIPAVALGVYKAPNDSTTEDAVKIAFEAGYRHVDSAARYANEEAVGRAVREFCSKSGVPREEIFVTTKLWDDDQKDPAAAVDLSLQKLGLEYVDLFLLHSPGKLGQEVRHKAYAALEDAVDAGKARSIGVSNFDVEELDDLLAVARIKPAVNQIESHPFFAHEELREACIARGIHIQAYSPMAQGQALDRLEIKAIAQKHDVSPAQVLLRWGLQVGNIILPKSLTKERIESNANLFHFELDEDDMELMNALDEGMKVGKLGPLGTSNPNSPAGSRRGSAVSAQQRLQMSSK